MSNKISLRETSSSHVTAFEQILFYRNIKNGQLTREQNLCPLEFEQAVGRPDSKNFYDIVNDELQHSFYIKIRVLVCRIRIVSNKIGFIMTYNYI